MGGALHSSSGSRPVEPHRSHELREGFKDVSVCAVLLLALGLAGCGGKTAEAGAQGRACGTPTLTNCPQGVVTGVGECPLPPVIEAQGFYTVGCKITAECSIGTQQCVCQVGPKGAQWACAL
jgi:hypothetical protein